jgi:carbonic anhydrase
VADAVRVTRAAALGSLAAAAALPIARTEATAAAAAPAGRAMTPAAALAELAAGNARYARDAAVNCNRNYHRRAEVSGAQAPFAIVLGCSDSRVPPEVVFDRRLGELFVVRLAGNIADDDALGSMEYAIEHFAPALLLVLGHEKCGAVAATVDALKAGSEPSGFVGSIVKKIMPAARRALGEPGNTLHDAIRENVRDAVANIRAQSTVARAAERTGALAVAGATYDLGDGRVTFL